MSYINLQSSKEIDQVNSFCNFATSFMFVVRRIVKRIQSDKIEYVILEFYEGEIFSPKSDVLIIGVSERNNEGRLYKQHALWNNKLWDIIEPNTIRMLATISGIDIPEENESARIRELNEQVEKMNAMHHKKHVN